MGILRGQCVVLCGILFCVTASLSAKRLDRIDATEPVPSNQPIPVMDFFRPHFFNRPRINPSGALVAALNPDKDDSSNLVVFDIAARKTIGTGGGEDFDVTAFEWLSDRRLLFDLSRNKLYTAGLFSADVDRMQRAIAINLRDLAIPVAIPQDEPLKPLIWLRSLGSEDGKDGGVVQIDSRRDVLSRAGAVYVRTFPVPTGGETMAYYADIRGELAYAVTIKEGVASLHRLENGRWVSCHFDDERLALIGHGDAANELIVLAKSDEAGLHPKVLRRYDGATGKLGEVLYHDDNYEPNPVGLIRSAKDRRIVGLSYNRKGPETVWLDPQYKEIQKELNSVLPGGVSTVFGSDREEKKFLVHYYSDQIPPRYFLYERNPSKVTLLANSAPWIDPNRMQPMQLMGYNSRDGVRIEGYLTLPANPGKVLPPLVVVPHGGPWVRDAWGWDPEAQFLASRGYAVFQPNYRGSPGTDWRFPEEDKWAFRKMHNDVTDGVRALIKAGLVDPDRIAIMGGSFGGYLSLCGAVYEGNLYRCAITIAGVFDWEQVMNEAHKDRYTQIRYGIFRRFLGDPRKQKEIFEEISPLRSVERVSIPVFVVHGKDDPVASINESRHLISELEKRKIPHEVMIERGEGHGFQHLENRVELYTRVEEFLARNLAPRPKQAIAASTAPVSP